MIQLISDTVTLPTPQMLEYMMKAEVGDDVFGQDPTVNALESKVARMFGKEAAVFCPSGTMTNQIAIQVHTNRLDEVICDHYSHVYQYETGGYAANAGVAIQLIEGEYGKITAEQIEMAIRPARDWLPESKLVVLENSCNKGGGSFYTLEEINPIRSVCNNAGLKLHLDGARLFNVLVETGEKTKEVGTMFDTISICISKGLGAPVGSLLTGCREDIRRARRFRKVMGGGMRQAGYLAAACIYALENHVERLKTDNERACNMGKFIESLPYVKSVSPVRTNIVIFHLKDRPAQELVNHLLSKQINSSAFGPESVRFVFHLGIKDEMINLVQQALIDF